MKKLKMISLLDNAQVLKQEQMKTIMGGSLGSYCIMEICNIGHPCMDQYGGQGICRSSGSQSCGCFY